MRPRRWAVAVTTVPSRRLELLPRTLASLEAAGWPTPRLCVDGCDATGARWYEATFGRPVSARHGPMRVTAHWILTAVELYLREPFAERYAVFQDDLVLVRNLRAYLDLCPFPEKGYWNLLSNSINERVVAGQPAGTWVEAACIRSGGPVVDGKRQQGGKGAVALVFNRDSLLTMLRHQHVVDKTQDMAGGHEKVDGMIVTALHFQGYREWVHCPSLVQHTGDLSTRPPFRKQPAAKTFPGEDFDALSWLPAGVRA